METSLNFISVDNHA